MRFDDARMDRPPDMEPNAESAASSEDLKEALQQCEMLLAEVDSGRRRIGLVQAVSLAAMGFAVLAIVLPETGRHGPLPWWGAGVGALAAILIVGAVSRQLVVRLRRQVWRDELIMVDLVGMQRELLPLLARDERWRSAQVFLVQKRMERFPIEPEQAKGEYRRPRPR